MAYIRTNAAGTRHTGFFRDASGTKRSAGTFDTPEEARKAAQEAEKHGTRDYPPTMTVKAWAEKFLKDTPTLTDRTRLQYLSFFEKRINPVLGDRLVGEVTRREVRAFLETMYKEGTGAPTVGKVKCALACIYKPLVVDDMLPGSPTDKIPEYRNPKKGFELVELDEFSMIRDHLPTPGARLLSEFLITLGLRFGEATEVRAGDISRRRGKMTIHVQRVVTDLGAKNNNGSRFKVLQGTKGKWNARKTRKVGVPAAMAKRLDDWIEVNGIKPDGLLFPVKLIEPDGRPPRNGNITGHLPRDTWRRIWKKAVIESKIGWLPRTHDLRHACASHMLEGGATLQEVKEAMGHERISTTEIYLHASQYGEETSAFDALWSA